MYVRFGMMSEVQKKNIAIQPLNFDQASEVSRLASLVYGDTYIDKTIYIPNELLNQNRSGRIFSAIGLKGDGHVVAHCAIRAPEEENGIGELCMGLTERSSSSIGALNLIGKYLIDKGRKLGYKGLFIRSFASQLYTQKLAMNNNFVDCCVLFEYDPIGTNNFRWESVHNNSRKSLIASYLFFGQLPRIEIYIPDRFQALIKEIYLKLGCECYFSKEQKQCAITKYSEIECISSHDASVATIRIGCLMIGVLAGHGRETKRLITGKLEAHK
jgi:hypothetical protein